MTPKSGFLIVTAMTLSLALSPLALAQATGSTGAGTPTTTEPALRGPLAPNGLSAPSDAGAAGNPQMGTTGATPGSTPTLTPDQSLGGTPVGGTPSSNAAANGTDALNPLSSPTTTVGSGGVVNGLGSSAANQPLQVVVGAVDLSVGKTPVELGPFIGVKVHVVNNTNSPLLLDGDRAALEKGSASVPAVTNFNVEGAADPPEPTSQIVKNATLAAVTIGANLAIQDEKVERGPVLGRFGGDERRREASAERFGKRIIWSGDSTEGVVFFRADTVDDINGGSIKLPVCTFPGLDIRGYVSTSAGGLETPVPPVTPLDQVGAPVKENVKDKATPQKQKPTQQKQKPKVNKKPEWPVHPPP